ncbi:MAG: hypothetical protein WC325_04615 [Candidatus Bathyarchaeia archaeon]|jgi:hypothetical protein
MHSFNGGLDIEIIKYDPNDPNIIPSAVKAYLNAKIPLIAHLRFEHKIKGVAYHAVVITGYKCGKNREIIELYVHDDGRGPYSRVYPDKNFEKWITDWKNCGYKVFLEQLIVPLYPKIRLQFKLIRKNFLQGLEQINKMKQKKDLTFELFLTTIQNYKNDLLIKNFDSKSDKIKALFPKFLWIERVYYKGKIFKDFIFDGTEVYPVEIKESPIRFK